MKLERTREFFKENDTGLVFYMTYNDDGIRVEKADATKSNLDEVITRVEALDNFKGWI